MKLHEGLQVNQSSLKKTQTKNKNKTKLQLQWIPAFKSQRAAYQSNQKLLHHC